MYNFRNKILNRFIDYSKIILMLISINNNHRIYLIKKNNKYKIKYESSFLIYKYKRYFDEHYDIISSLSYIKWIIIYEYPNKFIKYCYIFINPKINLDINKYFNIKSSINNIYRIYI